MPDLGHDPRPADPAATVVMVRDRERGPEVLLLRRSDEVPHWGGLWVFPGGRVEEADYPADRDRYAAAVNAAVRETREEAGITLRPEQLVYLSHWITPRGAPRRFATWFFLAVLEEEQEVIVDGGEISGHRWVRPADALTDLADPGHPFQLAPPTFVSLLEVAKYRSCLEACESIAAGEVTLFAPRVVMMEGGFCSLYEGDAGYADENPDAPGPRHRTYLIDGQLEYIRQC